jgi:hypothetical protein
MTLAMVCSGRSIRAFEEAAASVDGQRNPFAHGVLDGVVIGIGFGALGLVVGLQPWALAELLQALLDAALALEMTGRAIGLFGGVPLVIQRAPGPCAVGPDAGPRPDR